jgi:cell division protein FtsZ
MKGARGVIINVTGGADMTLFEVDEACNRIRDEVDPNANIIFGSTFDDRMDGRMRVSVVATGIDAEKMAQPATNNGGVKVTAVGKKLPESQPVFERAKPQANTIQQTTALQRAAVPNRLGITMPTAPAARFDEPERDMFEQQEFVAAPAPAAPEMAPVQAYAQQVLPQAAPVQQPVAQAAGLRGTLHDGHFIPPKPIVPEPQEPVSSYGMTGYTAQAQQGYNLRPPVPGASTLQQQQERKKTPSLFERITSGVRNVQRHVEEAVAPADEPYEDGGMQQQQVATGTGGGGFHASLRATPRIAENPAQGQLNIDAPAASRVKSEEELDIPAFLRRQAN